MARRVITIDEKIRKAEAAVAAAKAKYDAALDELKNEPLFTRHRSNSCVTRSLLTVSTVWVVMLLRTTFIAN